MLMKWSRDCLFQRGWTTWTVGAVDKRVVAIAPIVMDLLNMQTVSRYKKLVSTISNYDYILKNVYIYNDELLCVIKCSFAVLCQIVMIYSRYLYYNEKCF